MGPASACTLTPEGTRRPEPAWTRAFPGPRRRPIPAPADKEPRAAAMMRHEPRASLTFCPQGDNAPAPPPAERGPQTRPLLGAVKVPQACTLASVVTVCFEPFPPREVHRPSGIRRRTDFILKTSHDSRREAQAGHDGKHTNCAQSPGPGPHTPSTGLPGPFPSTRRPWGALQGG